ncbi:DNA-binding protein [Nocardiopsis akebiae]|uniref:DNA-binding protein n=1 Tax=Nocardiopsis akebiae TaxID=2831968 RepID=A0ABX8CAT6_9ACTN|nr:DNA-binding protein [Nocardiopsis akebiae]
MVLRAPQERVAEAVRSVSARVVALDTRYGARDTVDAAARAAARARGAARTRFPDSADVLAATAELHQVTGWVAFDAERQRLSRRMTLTALDAAGVAGDRSMEYFALSQLAMQDVHLWRPTEARRVCEAALAAGPAGSVRTLFTLRLARAAAQEGERTRARKLIGETLSRYLEGPRRGDPAWTWWLTEAEIAWHRAITDADAGAWGAAVEAFDRVAELTGAGGRAAVAEETGGSGRFLFHAAVSRLWVLARVGSWEEAEAVLVRDVLPGLGSVASVRCERRLAEAVRLLDTARDRPSLRDTARWCAERSGAGVPEAPL